MLRSKTKPCPVDFASNYEDRLVKRMKAKQFTHHAIANATGFTVSQVNYRVRKGNLSIPLAWRQGRTDSAKQTIVRIEVLLDRIKVLRRVIADTLAPKEG